MMTRVTLPVIFLQLSKWISTASKHCRATLPIARLVMSSGSVESTSTSFSLSCGRVAWRGRCCFLLMRDGKAAPSPPTRLLNHQRSHFTFSARRSLLAAKYCILVDIQCISVMPGAPSPLLPSWLTLDRHVFPCDSVLPLVRSSANKVFLYVSFGRRRRAVPESPFLPLVRPFSC
mgnify:CR=1 FL=1